MLERFKMEISKADLLRALNKGIRVLIAGSLGEFIEQGDRVTNIEYSRHTKRWTLVFESGRKLKVVEKKDAALT